MVIVYTICCDVMNTEFCSRIGFVRFVLPSQQARIMSVYLNSINMFVTDTLCYLRGKNWIFFKHTSLSRREDLGLWNRHALCARAFTSPNFNFRKYWLIFNEISCDITPVELSK